ncbi:MAG TPA: ectonucleotide pyrophosphatase/phosphodiesterase [Opitutaceae bacterium]|nr:ectonucleotide pyrophosphatase/phosphodiesterase [Opitutaceae bacterium]
MRRVLKTLFAVLVAFFLNVAEASPHRDRHVILISIDGFPAYLWRDPSVALPTLRALASEGVAADAMTVANPSVTWINHTTLITGATSRKHGVLYNGLLVRRGEDQPPRVDPHAVKEALIHVPALDDLVHAAGLTVGESAWPALTRSRAVSWSFPEVPSMDGKLEREMLAANVFTETEISWMQLSGRKNVPWLDQAWTRAAQYVFSKHRPNLLMLHIVNTDVTHHRYGPGSPPSYTALSYADRLVGDLVKTVNESGLRDRTTFIVTTDHGFKQVEKFLHPNVVLKQAGYLRPAGPSIAQCDAYVVTQGGVAMLFITNLNRKEELKSKLRTLYQTVEGIDQVVDAADAPKLGMPTDAENQGMSDLVLFAKAGYWFNSKGPVGDAVVTPAVDWFGAHGYLASDPQLDGIFIASGAGVKRGETLKRVRNLDVAPTIAHLLGLAMPTAEGTVMRQILASEE